MLFNIFNCILHCNRFILERIYFYLELRFIIVYELDSGIKIWSSKVYNIF